MKKFRITALLIVVCMVFSMLPFTALATDGDADKIIVHVSADAKFAGDGSESAPFKTIEAAKNYLRTKDHRKKHAEVLVHGGNYKVDTTIVFTSEDSGTEKFPVVYRAAGDGEVQITNSVKLDHMAFEPIKDKATITRLPSEVRDKVGVLSLENYGLDMSMFNVAGRTSNPQQHQMYPYIYLNGKQQEIAKWPNVGLQMIKTVVKQGELQSSGTVGERGEWNYENLRPERWLLADQALIRGYLGSEYCMDSVPFGGVKTDEKTIFLGGKSVYGVKPGHRWRIENLLEEIDSPGEYFVDYKTQKLYFYPPYKLKESDTLEVSTYSKTYVQFSGASYIVFDGIGVSGSVNNYGIHISNSNNITIRNSTFYNLYRAIYLNGTSRNNLIEACTIYDINATAVGLQGGGDPETLTPGNNRVSNCHFYNWGLGTQMQNKVAVDVGRGGNNKTIGDTVENCIIHGQPNGQGIFYGGVENVMRYNEIYSLTNDTADMGAIYCGRNLAQPGNVVAYNYIHDFAPIFEARYQLQGIYWDDWQSGQIAHHNIIVPGSKQRTAGNLFVGADSYYCENIVVNSDIGVRATDRGTAIHSSAYSSAAASYATPALIEKYPAIATYRPQLEKDNMILLLKGNVFENNLSVDVNRNTFAQGAIDNGSIKNNQISDDYSVFVDAANHDYRLKREAVKEFGFPETFLNEDNFDMDMIGIQPEVMEVQKAETPFQLLYPKNGQMDVIRNSAYIKWEAARYADIYEYVVATDPELTNVVASGKSLYNVVELPDLKNDTVYYYKVWAKNLSKQIGNTWESTGVPYMFKTTKEDVLEKEFLKDEIESIKALKETINVGEQIGMYKPEALTDLDKLLKNAQSIVTKTVGSEAEIDETVASLKAFKNGISGYKHAGHEALNVKDGEWVAASAAVSVTETDDTVKIESFGNSWAYLDEKNPGHIVKHYKMKVNISGWMGMALKQSDPKVQCYDSSLNTYLIVIKPDQIEFQKYNPAASKTGVITKYPNDYIKNGEWVDIEFGCVDVIGGVNVFLKVNGKTVFNEFDAESPNFGDGYFVIRPGSEGSTVELQQADPTKIPSEEFVFEGASAMEEAKIIYNLDNKIAQKEGNWTDGTGTTADGSNVKVSTDANAKVTYTVTDTEVAYKTYYYHTPQANGDKNATISMVAYSPTDGGKTNVTRKVDFSSGEEGWVYLGTYECASYSKTGDIIITIEGSGEGALVAPVIGTVEADKELLEFNRTFYDYSENLLLMQIDNQKAYTAIDELQIPDAAPYIENNITMVPLRFVAEAFNAQVDWNAESQKATIRSGDKIVEFTLGSKVYTANGSTFQTETEAKLVNGRTMIPLRATAEALGKMVMWYGDAKLIFIADSLGFTEADSTKLENAAKGFERGYN